MDFVFAHQNGIDVHGDAFCCDTFPACWSTDLISTGQTHSSLSLSVPLALALTHFNRTAGQTFKTCASLTGSLRQKCHLSTCALMINTVLMISINFLLRGSRSALLGFCHGPEFGPVEISEGSWLPLILGDFGLLAHWGEYFLHNGD